jgi:hypothetical protein
LPISTLNEHDTGNQLAHRELPKLPSFAIFASLFGRGYPKNLELILRDVEAKGYLDIELVY